METMERTVIMILGRWRLPGKVGRLEPLGNAGGFSGSRLWRVETAGSDFCLRRWPPAHPTPERLDWIHRVLRRVAASGCDFVPRPLVLPESGTWVSGDGALWELTPWMPGEANYRRQPGQEKLESALSALALWHEAARVISPGLSGQSAGLVRRHRQLKSVDEAELRRLERAVDGRFGDLLQRMASEILEMTTQTAEPIRIPLGRAVELRLPLQPCIRDVWHDHVLFIGDRVSGILDYGAMDIDTVAGDVARLLGSLVGNDPKGWRVGIDAYRRVRPLTTEEESLLAILDRSNCLLGGLNWIRWLFLEGRSFENLSGVVERMSEIAGRLRAWCDEGAH